VSQERHKPPLDLDDRGSVNAAIFGRIAVVALPISALSPPLLTAGTANPSLRASS
jgi:hypothetical protein